MATAFHILQRNYIITLPVWVRFVIKSGILPEDGHIPAVGQVQSLGKGTRDGLYTLVYLDILV